MTTRFTIETSALGTVNYHRRRDSAIAGIIVQLRPHPSGDIPDGQLADAIMSDLAAAGWESPVLMYRGGHLATRGKVTVTGRLEHGDLTLTRAKGQRLHAGAVPRPTIWAGLARAAGSIAVIAYTDPAIVLADIGEHILQLAEDGKLLAAAGTWRA